MRRRIALHSTSCEIAGRLLCFAKPWGRPRVVFQHGGCAVANNSFTASRESAIIVKTPRIVPKGIDRQSKYKSPSRSRLKTKANPARQKSSREIQAATLHLVSVRPPPDVAQRI